MTAGPRKPVYRFGFPGRVKGRTRCWGYAPMAAAKMRREMAYPILEDGVVSGYRRRRRRLWWW
ncbi:hypothetical protein Pyn_27435 [Prunus yedoensis var. nudiflora]|uniref:Uncharacterized protein n=1 Tax=Prunus yedoensis var. nudiflora TaxID=2094558 RepID=A0A314XM85_PRUYE|nr:hypothetical protein Pyn_27435 [Prunus yedoensis var. nudiflora]